MPLASGYNLKNDLPTGGDRNDVKTMQQALRDKGRYSGPVDGVLGLRTRAGIRGYQKAKSLPITGQLDTQTANKLGVRPEGREEAGYEAAKSKPSAGTKLVKRTERASKVLRKAVKTLTTAEASEPVGLSGPGRRD